jgi:hypothetical protein
MFLLAHRRIVIFYNIKYDVKISRSSEKDILFRQTIKERSSRVKNLAVDGKSTNTGYKCH